MAKERSDGVTDTGGIKPIQQTSRFMLQLKHHVQAPGNRKNIKKWDACLGLST